MSENMNNACTNCGCTNEELFELEVNGETVNVCADCAEALGFVQCADCGEWIPEDEARITADGDTICESCYDDDYFTCEDCGEIHPNSELVEVNPGTYGVTYVCESCADRNYYKCEECGEYFSDDRIHEDHCGTVICDDCYERYDYVTCEDCERIVRYDDANYCESDGCYYCDNCVDDHNDSGDFHNYGYKPEPEFQYRSGEGTNRSQILTFGVELEVDCGDDHEDLSSDLVQLDQPIYMKHDGSLGSEGVEIVTHPCSLAYHQYELRWAEIGRTCKAHDYTSHDAGTCGLHIHIGRQQMGGTFGHRQQTAGNLVLLANALWDQLVRFSRREEGQLEHWACRPCLNLIFGVEYSDSELTDIALGTERHGRYQAVNLCNCSTVELRLFRGTLKRDTIIASIQLANNLTLYAKTHTPTECLNANWADVIGLQQFEELNHYCMVRGIV